MPEATTVGHRSSTNPRPSIFEDFDLPEATTLGHRGAKNPRPAFFESFGTLCNDEPPQRLEKSKAFIF